MGLFFDKGDFESICADLSFTNWTDVFTGDMDYNVSVFNSIITSLIEKYIPTKLVKNIVLPIWWSSECENARARKENLRKK